MTDYYKILNISFKSSETEIKKQYRKLANIYHPDKNCGCTIKEEKFKIILTAYEILSDKEKRAIYDFKYKQYFNKQKSYTTNKNNSGANTNTKPRHSTQQNREYQKKEKSKPRVNYSFWVIVVIIVILYLYDSISTTTKGNAIVDEQLEEQNERPESGELNFKNN